MKLFLCAFLSAVALASIGIASNLMSPASGHVPVEIGVAGGTIGAGNTVTYRIQMDNAGTQDQVVSISASMRNAYSALPLTVTVPAYQDEVEFQATISNNPPASWTLYASSNGVTVSMPHSMPPAR